MIFEIVFYSSIVLILCIFLFSVHKISKIQAHIKQEYMDLIRKQIEDQKQ